MADLSDIQAAQSVKVIGASSSGSETTPMAVDTHQTAQTGLYDPNGNAITADTNDGISNNQRLHVATPDTVVATVALGSLNAAVTIAMSGLSSVGLQLAAGTLVGTLVVEFSLDGGSTYPVAGRFYDPTSFNTLTSLVFNSSNTAKTVSILPIGGTSHVRVRVSSYTSGTANALLRASSVIPPTIAIPAAYSYFHPIFTTRVQSNTAANGALGTSQAVTIASSKAGNFIVVAVSTNVIGTVTVTDNLSQTYSTAVTGTSSVDNNRIFYKENTAAGVTTITVTSTASTAINIVAAEYSGVVTVSSLDKTSTGNVSGTTAFNSGSTSATINANELLIGSAYGTTKNNSIYTAGTGWTSVGLANGFNAGAGELFLEEQYVQATGSYAATGTASANDSIIADIATFTMTTINNLTILNQPKVIKSGPGVLSALTINTIGSGGATATLYDGTDTTGTVIAVISLTNSPKAFEYNVSFTNGLTLVLNSITADITVTYA